MTFWEASDSDSVQIVGKREVGRRLRILDKHASFRRPAPHIPPGNLKTLGEEKLGDEKADAAK